LDIDLNRVTLTGTLARNPLVQFADHATQQVCFTLKLTEAGPAGQAFNLYVPVAAYSQVAELAGELAAGAAVLVAGKLKWTSWTDTTGQKRTNLCVLAQLVRQWHQAGVEASS
jgi:single-stranded DNA-binding protein